MLTSKQRILIALTGLAAAGAVATLIWARTIDQQLQNPPLLQKEDVHAFSGQELETPEQESGLLVSNFEGILSQEQLAELYEGEQDFGFTS